MRLLIHIYFVLLTAPIALAQTEQPDPYTGRVDTEVSPMQMKNEDDEDVRMNPNNNQIIFEALAGHMLMFEFRKNDVSRNSQSGSGNPCISPGGGTRTFCMLSSGILIMDVATGAEPVYRIVALPTMITEPAEDVEGASGRPKIIVNQLREKAIKFLDLLIARGGDDTTCLERFSEAREVLLSGAPIDKESIRSLYEDCIEAICESAEDEETQGYCSAIRQHLN